MFNNTSHVTNFRLDIPDLGGTENFQVAIQNVTIPSITISSVEIPVNPMNTGQIPGTTMMFDPLNVRILVDEELKSYLEVYKWMISVVDYKSMNSTAHFEGTAPKTIYVNVLDNSKKKIVAKYRFNDAWPSVLGELTYDFTEDTNIPISCIITFMYKSFDIIDINGNEIRPYARNENGSGLKLHPFSN